MRTKPKRPEQRALIVLMPNISDVRDGWRNTADPIPKAQHMVLRGHLLADRGMCDLGVGLLRPMAPTTQRYNT